MTKFLSTSGFKCRDPKGFEFNKYTSPKGRVIKVDIEYPK